MKMEVAAYTETWVRVYQITWGYVLGGFSLEEFTSAGRGAMCPSFITFFVFEAPSSPDIPSPHTCQVAPCRRLESHLRLHHTVLASLSCSHYLD